MKILEILKKYGLAHKRGNYINGNWVYGNTFGFSNGDIANGGKTILNEYMDSDVIAHHLEDYGGFFVFKSQVKYYAFLLFSNNFYVGGMDFKSHRIKDLSDVEKKIDLTKLTIINQDEYNLFLKAVEIEKQLKIVNNI